MIKNKFEDQLLENTMRYKKDPLLFVLDFYVSVVAIHYLRDLVFMFL